jgi:N-acetylglucosamine-6-phosphate deacetylase
MPDNLLIKNISLFDRPEPARYSILTTGGKIAGIAPAGEIQHSGVSIDGSGLIAVPGLIDIHIHGAGGADSLDGTREAFVNISRTLARLGTTSFLTTMVMRPGEENTHLRIAGECAGKDLGGAGMLGIYIEGPFINKAKRGGILPGSITEPSREVLESIFEKTGNSLKMMCVAPEIPGISNIIKYLLSSGVKVAFGHSDADYTMTREGFDMGISHVTHLFNAMRPIHHRDPGPVAAIFENPDISVELIGDSHHVHPSLYSMIWKLKGPLKMVCVTDGISGMGLPDGTYVYNNQKYISENGLARYLDGTFIGSTMSLVNIFRNFKNITNCTLKEAIDTVTLNPARVLGIDNQKGSLDKGKDADIVLLDPEFNVQYTIIAGQTIYRKDN